MNLTGRSVCERPEAAVGEFDASSPFLVEFFLVQGINFCCMAYLDADGKWRGAFDKQELFGVLRVVA